MSVAICLASFGTHKEYLIQYLKWRFSCSLSAHYRPHVQAHFTLELRAWICDFHQSLILEFDNLFSTASLLKTVQNWSCSTWEIKGGNDTKQTNKHWTWQANRCLNIYWLRVYYISNSWQNYKLSQGLK